MSHVAEVQHEMPHLQPMPNNYEEIGRGMSSSCDRHQKLQCTGEEPASLLPLLAAIEGSIAEECQSLAVENSSGVELTVQNKLF